MNKTISFCCLIIYIGASVSVVASRPEWVSDQNKFMLDFVGSQFLAILGTILAITLASIANIHLELNKIEERFGVEGGLEKTRRNLRQNAAWLIGLFVAGIMVVAIKPLVSSTALGGPVANLSALFILLFHILQLTSIMQLVFQIPPTMKR